MKNSTYWANRMRILENSLLDTGYEYVQNLEKQYDLAIAEIDRKIAAWYQRFAKNNEITLAEAKRLLNSNELKEFRWTVEEYIKNGEASAISGEWKKQLENASSRVHISRLDSLKVQLRQEAEALHGSQLKATESLLSDTYREGYFHTAFEIQKGLGIGWSLHGLTGTEIQKVLSRPWTPDGQTFRDRVWVNKQALVNSVNTNLTQMIMRGEAPDRAIKAIAKQFNVSKNKAGRLVMTESAAFSSAAQKDCFSALDVEYYKIIGTLDSETCELCGELDGKVYKMSDYQVGATAPPFHPWCRCCTAPYFADMDSGNRIARNAEGKTYEVPADMTYKEWHKKSVTPTSTVKTSSAIKNYRKTDTGDKKPWDSLSQYTDKNGELIPEREQLHREIIDNYFKNAKPANGQATFTVMGGGPASGKSTMIKSGAATLPENSITIDPDAIKAQLPEYNKMLALNDKNAAGFVHEESSALAKRIMKIATKGNYNYTLDGTGDGTVASLKRKIEQARKAGYSVQGLYATVPTQTALERAMVRGEKTGRVVNPDIIKKTHRAVSQILPECAELFDSVKLYDMTDGSVLIGIGGNGQKLTAIKGQEELFQAFLDKAFEK